MLAPSCVVTAWWYCVREECVMGCVMLYDRVKLSLFDSCTPLYYPPLSRDHILVYTIMFHIILQEVRGTVKRTLLVVF